MQTAQKTTRSPRIVRVYTPEESCSKSFFDAFADVFTHPEDLTLHRPDSGNAGRIRDGENIRGYFDKAIGRLLDEEKQKGNTISID